MSDIEFYNHAYIIIVGPPQRTTCFNFLIYILAAEKVLNLISESVIKQKKCAKLDSSQYNPSDSSTDPQSN